MRGFAKMALLPLAQDFELVLPNICPIYGLLEHVKVLVLYK